MRDIFKSLGIVVGIPTLLATLYFGFIASDVYISEARFAIRSSSGSSGVGGLASLLASPIASGSSQESMVVEDYAESADMLASVEQQLDLVSHYSSKEVDVLSRLSGSSTREEFLEYINKRLELQRDTTSDVITLKARAYDPEMAQQFAQAVIKLSENLVNTMSGRIEEDALDSAHREVERAFLKVKNVSERMMSFRNINKSINPAEESSALLGIVSGIEGKLVEARSTLSEKRAYMRETAPEIVSLKNRINALNKQLAIEKGRLVGSGGQNPEMSGLIEDYRPLVLEQELAQQQYASALTSLEMARLEATRKKQYLITFIKPNLPDEAIEPYRLNRILTVMVFSFMFYGIGGLMWSALRDHIGR